MSDETEFFVLPNRHRSGPPWLTPLSLAKNAFSRARETLDLAPDVAALAFARDQAERPDSAAEQALSRLHDAIKALPDRFALPCWGGSLPVGWWTSDDRSERETAAERCGECPVVVDCRAAGDAGDEPAGVWGGVDRVPRPRKPGRKPR